MTSLNVTFDVPQWILGGLSNGSLERVGGVVRRADGKNVVMWLREGVGKLQDNVPDALSQLSTVLTNQNIMMGLQAANLAVSAVGIAVMCYKLDKIENQLVGLDSKLDKLGQDLGWLDNKQLVSHLAPVVAAAKHISSVDRIKSDAIAAQMLTRADGDLGAAKEYFREVLGRMLARRFENDRPEEFSACYRAWVMSSQGCVAVMALRDELPEALHRIGEFKHEHTIFGEDYRDRRSDLVSRLRAGAGATAADNALNAVAHEIASVHDIIRGQSLQLEFVEREGLTLGELDTGIDVSSVPYVCYSVK